MRGLTDRLFVVTGAASGIGLSTCERLLDEGAAVAGWDLAETDAWRELTEGKNASFHTADVADAAAVAEAYAATKAGLGSTMGPIHGIVTAAGVAGGGPVHSIADSEWDRVIAINLTGTLLCVRAVLADMMEARAGSIVTIASVEGLEGAEGGSAYNASKAGVVNLTRNLAVDYGRMGIRANSVCPGFIVTPMFDSVFGSGSMANVRDRIEHQHKLGRFGEASELASACTFLLSDEASFITGVALPVDGGFTAGHSVGVAEMLGLS